MVFQFHDAEYQKFNISREDNGFYVCNVSNTIGYGVDKVQISVYCKRILFANSRKQSSHLLTVDMKHDKPIYTMDGRYQCSVSNGVPDEKNITFQNGYKDVNFPGKPHCFRKNNEEIIRNLNDTVIITFDVYSSTITRSEWWHGNYSLNQTFEYEYTKKQSTTYVTVYGISISLNTTTFALKISNLTEAHLETEYSLFVFNEQGNSTCSRTLLEGRVPAKPEKFEVIPLKGSFEVAWLPEIVVTFNKVLLLNIAHCMPQIGRQLNIRRIQDQKHWSVYEEVILNPAQNGKRFIINTIPVDDDLNTSG
ncbi:unnamed protein product [Mytilus edulis]|uniref:Uncharacterized protein n=1 Tax=Mytilus edulis TaxID=6550 RepID=A0A8S3QGA9_MYTED|nr:unnamed protein product [Mytilus edulis]